MNLIKVILSLVLYIYTSCQVVDITGIKIVGGKIVNGKGVKVQLRGVNKSGSEFACIQGWGFWDGSDLAAITANIKSWKANIVRLPLNEHCWLGINVKPEWGGANYIKAIDSYINLILSNGMAVILDLHWTSSTGVANKQDPMPNKQNSIPFWKSVATKYGSNSQIIFDLFNEPFPDNNQDTTNAWSCIKSGNCPGINYPVAGMQELVSTIRTTGAKNILMVSGPQYSNSLTRWIEFLPVDPLKSIAASWHSYNFNLCNNQACWDKYIGPVIASYPLIVGEIGENDCSSGYITPLMKWLDSKQAHYLAWTFNAWDCSSGPALIKADGQPTNFGIGFKAHLLNETGTCDPTKTIPVSFPSSNEWWLQTSFGQAVGQMYNVQIVFGSKTFTLSQSSWSSFDFTTSTNGVQIPTGSAVILKATIINVEYTLSLNWLKVSNGQLKCVKKLEESTIISKCDASKVINAKLSYEGMKVIKASFLKTLGHVKSVSVNDGSETTKLKQTFWSNFKFMRKLPGFLLLKNNFSIKVEINGVEYKGNFNWNDNTVKLIC